MIVVEADGECHVSDPNDDELIERVKGGDRAAFAGLVDRYWDRVCQWLLRLTGSREAAEDITQDVFLKIWVGLPQYAARDEARVGFRAWLFRIARNAWIDHCRRRAEVSGVAEIDAATREAGPLEAAQERELAAFIEQAVLALAEEYRAPFLLRVGESLPYQEIAEIMGLNEDTVRWRIFKARQILLKTLAPYFGLENVEPPVQSVSEGTPS